MVKVINEHQFDKDEFIKELQAAGISKKEMLSAKSQGVEAFRKMFEEHGFLTPIYSVEQENIKSVINECCKNQTSKELQVQSR